MPLTKNDLRLIENIMDLKQEELREEFTQKFNKVFNVLDSILFEVKNYRIEQDVVGHRITMVEQEVETLKKTN